MKYNSKEEAQKDHLENYRGDGVRKRKGERYSSDYFRVGWIISNVPKESYVLDVGCNTGAVSLKLKQLGCYVKGIELVPEIAKIAQHNGVFCECGEAEDLSRYNDNEFDCVVCTEVLEHLFDPLVAIKEAYRVLKPGGRYVVTVPHPEGFCQGKGDYHNMIFTLEILDTLFYSVFDKDSVNFIEIPYIPEYCQANRIDPKQPQWIGLVAKKGITV